MNNVITIDGPSGSGKSTISRLLAEKIGFHYLDTGAMYRAVALAAQRKGIPMTDGKRLGELCRNLDLHFNTDERPARLFLGREDISGAIRTPDMDMLASEVSAVPEVRKEMTGLQRRMATGVKLVAEGRDMGTVVFSEAENKFFLTASAEIRSKRRFDERIHRGESVSLNGVTEELKKRDHQDQTRTVAPLKPAEDAKIIDSTALTPEEVVQKILDSLDDKTE